MLKERGIVVRVVSGKHILQATLYDADLMMLNKRDAEEVAKYVVKRLKPLLNPPHYLKVLWGVDGMIRGHGIGFDVGNQPDDDIEDGTPPKTIFSVDIGLNPLNPDELLFGMKEHDEDEKE